MAVFTNASLSLRYSQPLATEGDQLPQTDPDLSLGRYISQTQAESGSVHNLFDHLSAQDNADLTAHYRCLFIVNSHPTISYRSVAIWISSQVDGGARVALGVDPAAATLVAASALQAALVADEETAPAGVTFSEPITKATGLFLGDVPAGHCKAFWVRRTGQNTGSDGTDGAILTFSGFATQ